MAPPGRNKAFHILGRGATAGHVAHRLRPRCETVAIQDGNASAEAVAGRMEAHGTGGTKPWLAARFKALAPALMARDTLRELRTFLRIARPLLTSPARVMPPQEEINLVSRFSVPAGAALADLDQFSRWLASGARPPQGADSLYLSPTAWTESPLASVSCRYPVGSGLKISKSLGDVSTPYMSLRSGRRLQRQLAGSHSAQVRTYNFLHLQGIGPRLWDIVELVDGAGAVRVAYVIEHIKRRHTRARRIQPGGGSASGALRPRRSGSGERLGLAGR